ncbi:MAG: YbaK/EbsC family protein [Chloroflexi bacterium]|nr:YbaK/EbsC family protein [Chloroflexota bacterium]
MKNVMTPAIRHLEERGVDYRILQHNGPILSLEQAARERNQLPSQVVRSIVFRLAEDTFLMVLMPGPGQVPWKQLRRYLNQTRLTMASEEELLAATGYRPGTVTPFGLPRPMRILIDQGVLDQPEISLGSGQRGTAIIMRPENLLAALDRYEIVNFSGETA